MAPSPSNVQTMVWRDHALHLIDQRVLPRAFDIVNCHDAAEVAVAIRDMVVRGAPAIGCAAAFGIAAEAHEHRTDSRPAFDTALGAAFEVLAASRPTAVNLFWALSRMKALHARLKALPVPDAAMALEQEAIAMLAEDIAINRAIGAAGAALVPQGARIMTHCNAGALATGGHGTALGVIRSAVEAGKRVAVLADETRPFLQGARLTVWELQRDDIPVTLITDTMSGYLMSRGEIDCVIVGADRVAANGDVANKIGTYMVAVLARRHGIPFYVACPLSTIDRSIPSGTEIPIEERAPHEVVGFQELTWAPENTAVRNPAFDVTPAELVTALITERGVVMAPDRMKIKALFETADERR